MIRVFPRKTKWTPTDFLSYVGDPPLFRPPDQPVNISVTFTWDIEEGERLFRAWSGYYPDVKLGGPAFGDPGGDFTPGRFIKDGVTITSRGCNKCCPFCYVPKREGKIRELPIKNGYIVQDNNLLACSKDHIENVFDMLRKEKKGIVFSGGIDPLLLRPWHKYLFDSVNIHELWFSCDDNSSLKNLERAANIFVDIPPYKRRCYVLLGFNGESILDAEKRVEKVFELGFYPFAQLYRGDKESEYSKEWRRVARKWSRPAAYAGRVVG